jgi:UDP-3-O-[3-hydroxymyristoyl] glucosamine N-acyltransferase
MVGGEIVGPAGVERCNITGLARIEGAGPGEITFVGAPQYERFLATTRAAAVIVTPELARQQDEDGGIAERSALLQVEDPYRAFMKLMGAFNAREEALAPGIHPTAIVPASASVHPEARVGAYAVLGERVTVGARSCLWPHVVLSNGVTVGTDCTLYPNVVVREGCWLGDRVTLHPGVVIGADGFGYLPGPDGRREKVPQIGTVCIEDDVEIGANTTVDRATLDRTLIRRGTKIDNLVQIAHNVEVGEDTCIAAQAGISGSTRLGARNLIGGQAGFVGHTHTCDDVSVMAHSGIMRSIDEPGVYAGSPARERAEAFRGEAAFRRLPNALRRLQDLERRIAALEGRRGEGSG